MVILEQRTHEMIQSYLREQMKRKYVKLFVKSVDVDNEINTWLSENNAVLDSICTSENVVIVTYKRA